MANVCHNTLEVSGPADKVSAAADTVRQVVMRFDWGHEPEVEVFYPPVSPHDGSAGRGFMRGWFDTRWSPPVESFEKLSQDFPDLRFHLAFDDIEGGALSGWITLLGGEDEEHKLYGFSIQREIIEHFPGRFNHRHEDAPPF